MNKWLNSLVGRSVCSLTVAGLIGLACFIYHNHHKEVPKMSSTGKFSQMHIPSSDMGPKLSAIQIPFIENKGQLNSEVSFYAQTFAGPVYVTKTGELVYVLQSKGGGLNDEGQETKSKSRKLKSIVIKETLVGGEFAEIKGEGESVTKVSSFIGRDPSKWQKNIATYSIVGMGQIYQGIELRLKAYGKNVEKLFYIGVGAVSQQIRVKVDGANDLKVDEKGELVAMTEVGEVRFTKPMAYQEIEGERIEVQVEYDVEKIKGSLTYGFKVGNYNNNYMLVIDPVLAFVGGATTDYCQAIALDSVAGDVYIIGSTSSSDFPVTVESYDTGLSSETSADTFVLKLAHDLSQVQSGTFIGGNSSDFGYDIAIHANGDIFIAGLTYSNDFPTTSGVVQSQRRGHDDIFVARLDHDLTTLFSSTYLGGSDRENIPSRGIDKRVSLALGRDEEVVTLYIGGLTGSSDFVASTTDTSSFDSTLDGRVDGFVAKLDGDLTTLQAFTYIGLDENGYYREECCSLAVSESGDVYAGGSTSAAGVPFPVGTFYDASYNGGAFDAFVSRYDSNLGNLVASTYIGGDGWDLLSDIALDQDGNVYGVGRTALSSSSGLQFPTTVAVDSTAKGGFDNFIFKLDAGLTRLVASTLLGGNNSDEAAALVVDSGNVYLTGLTYSTNYPRTDTRYGSGGGNIDTFLSVLSDDLSRLIYSTVAGGDGTEWAGDLAVSNGEVFITGEIYGPHTDSLILANFDPGFDTESEGFQEGFVSMFALNRPPSNLIATAVSPTAIYLFWDDNSITEEYFSIEQSEGGCNSTNAVWTRIAGVRENSRQYKVTDLRSSTPTVPGAYSFRVKAFDPNRQFGYSNCAEATTGKTGTPHSPSHLKVESLPVSGDQTSGRVKIEWKDRSSNEEKFQITQTRQFRDANGNLQTTTTTFRATNVTSAANLRSVREEALNNQGSDTYSYGVQACNSAGCSPKTRPAYVPKRGKSFSVDTIWTVEEPKGPTDTELVSRIQVEWLNSGRSTGYIPERNVQGCVSNGWKRDVAGASFVRSPKTGFMDGDTRIKGRKTVGYRVRNYYSSGGWPRAVGYSQRSACEEDSTLPTVIEPADEQ